MTGALVALYSQDYNPCAELSDATPGMKVLEDLRDVAQHLEAAKPLVKALGAKDGTPLFDGKELLAAERAAKDNGVKVTSTAEIAMKRSLAAALRSDNFTEYFRILNPKGTGGTQADGAPPLHINMVTGADKKSTLQQGEIVKTAIELLRVDNNKDPSVTIQQTERPEVKSCHDSVRALGVP